MDEPLQIPPIVVSRLLRPLNARVVERARGGLSQSSVYRCENSRGDLVQQFCLRQWRDGQANATHIGWVQTQIGKALAAGITPLPAFFCDEAGASLVADGNDLWELTEWKPGTADYLLHPNRRRLRSAVHWLAKLHSVFESEAILQPSPAIEQRWRVLQEANRWAHGQELSVSIGSALTGLSCSSEELRLVEQNLTRTFCLLREHGERLAQRLRRTRSEPTTCVFALRDVWSDHLLFSGDEVTGLIDFGAARIDEPATDLARMLGSLEPDDTGNWQFGFTAYQEVFPPLRLERVALLDEVSTLLSANQWRRWVTEERREFRVSLSWQLRRWESFLDRYDRFDWRALVAN